MNCVYCSKEFVEKKQDGFNKKFCSHSCRNSHYRMKKKVKTRLSFTKYEDLEIDS